VWILNKSPKRHLPRGFLFRSIHSPPSNIFSKNGIV
jgi:hypothetical protein